jgi:hypothetical protein
MLSRVLWQKFTDASEVLAASIIRAVKAASTSESSMNFYQTTRRNIPEESHLHTRRRENLKYHRYASTLYSPDNFNRRSPFYKI